MSRKGVALWTGRLVLGAGRLGLRLLPARLRKSLDDRLFGAIFQVTRVTNDAYGWRPEPAPSPTPSAGEPPVRSSP